MTNAALNHEQEEDFQVYDNSDTSQEFDDDGEFYEISYEDDRENYAQPSDLEAIADDDKREAALTAEDKIPLHQQPLAKVAGVVGVALVSIGAVTLFFTATQPKGITQKTQEVKGKDSTNLNFGITPEDANKAEIALGKQRDAFAGTATETTPPGQTATNTGVQPPNTAVTTTPTIEVVPPKKEVKLEPVAKTPPVQPSAIVKPPAVAAKVAPAPSIPVVAKVIPPVPVVKASVAPAPVAKASVAPVPVAKASVAPAPVAKASVAPAPVAKASVAPVPVAKASVAPVPVAKASVAPASVVKAPELSPEEQWLKLSEAGRFGGRYTSEPKQVAANPQVAVTANQPDSTTTNIPTNTEQSPLILKSQPQVINISDRSKDRDEDLIPILPEPENTDKPNALPVLQSFNNVIPVSLQSEPTLLAQLPGESKNKDAEKQPLGAAEAELVNNAGKAKIHRIAPGTRISGTLLTPVQASGSSAGEQTLVIKLDQPILDQDNRIAVTAKNTQITFKWQMQDGWIQATSESLVIDGKSVAIPGAFALQGDNGQPLIAGDYRPGAGEIAGADQNAFLLGSVAGVGDILTQPDTTINNGVFGSSTSTSTPNRNILGAIFKGGATPVLDSQKKRNDRRAETILARKPIWYLQPGIKVNLFTTAPLTVSN